MVPSKRMIGILLAAILMAGSADSKAQDSGGDLPRLFPGKSRVLTIDDALPTDCFEQLIIDPDGRTWLTTCGDAQRNRRLNLLQFDGHEGNLRDLGLPQGALIVLGGFVDDSTLVGCELTFHSVFTYNIHTGSTHVVPAPEDNLNLYNVRIANGTPYALAFHDNTHYIFELSNGNLVMRHELKGFTDQNILHIQGLVQHVAVVQNSLWFTDASARLHCFDTQSGQLRSFTTPDGMPLRRSRLINWNGRFVVATSGSRGIHVYWIEDDRLVDADILPAGWEYSAMTPGHPQEPTLYADDSGWLLVGCADPGGQQRTLLVSRDGALLDYTRIFARIAEVEFGWISSHDFTDIAFTDGGRTTIVEVSRDYRFETLATASARSMVAIDSHLVLCLTDVQPIIIDLADQPRILSAPFYAPERKVVQMDDGQGIWLTSKDTIMRFDLNGGIWTKYPCQSYVDLFELHDGALFFTSHGKFFKCSPETGTIEDLGISADDPLAFGYPNQLDIRGTNIWVATSNGLWQADLSSASLTKHRVLQDPDMSVLALYIDQSGSIWLGTELHGVIKYDPVKGSVAVCDRPHGLSHNTVVGLLEDEQGNIWANTFSGISAIDPEMNVLATFHQSEGLIHNEGNRWSALTLPDGRLAFGTIAGITIIEPALALRTFAENPVPNVYIQSLKYAGRKSDSTVILVNPDIESRQFKLPFDRRSISIGVGLSDILASSSNEYTYRFDLPGYDWVSTGNQQNMVVTNLPYGDYAIEIRGKNANGIWSSNTARLQVDVAWPFYRKWWFYVLSAVPFVTFISLWMLRNQRERRRLETEVQRRTKTIAEQAEDLRQLDLTKTRLYTNITHEFRTPLTVIKGVTETLKDDPQKTAILSRNTNRLLNLVNQMLELSKLESGHLQVNIVRLNMIHLIRDIFESFVPVAEDKEVGMHFYAKTGEIEMDCDIEITHRIAGNLMSNAVKFTPAGGNVYVEVDEVNAGQEPLLLLSVRDTGIGIDEDQVDKIFNRFHQVDNTTTRAGEGTGIGLALTRELVHFLNGTLEVQSRKGEGSTFLVHLPITRKAQYQAEGAQGIDKAAYISQQSTMPEMTATEQPALDLPSVLLVDDNPDIIHYLVSCLRDDYRLLIAADGQEGVDKAIQYVPDLIISDVMMPGKDGIQLCHEVKQDERTSHIPVILLTAKADIASRIEGLQRGADAYMAKPFEKQELLLIMRNLIATRQRLRERYLGDSVPASSQDPAIQVEDAFMTKLHSLINAHLDDEEFGVLTLSHALKYSRSQIHNKVKALTGMSTSAYIQNRRMLHAKKLLLSGDLNISEVGYSVGFRDPNYFSRVFRKAFGLSPSEFIDARSESL